MWVHKAHVGACHNRFRLTCMDSTGTGAVGYFPQFENGVPHKEDGAGGKPETCAAQQPVQGGGLEGARAREPEGPEQGDHPRPCECFELPGGVTEGEESPAPGGGGVGEKTAQGCHRV